MMSALIIAAIVLTVAYAVLAGLLSTPQSGHRAPLSRRVEQGAVRVALRTLDAVQRAL